MQTVWNRVAQVRGTCRCPQCVPTINGISRRAAASATQRAPKYLTSSTLWYSGIFAVAATFDAGMKQQRREKWDKAIAEVKQQLARPMDALDELPLERDAVQEETHSFVPLGVTAEDDMSRYADGNTKAAWPANTGPPLEVHRLPLNSIYAEDWQRGKAERTRWTAKKIAKVQNTMDTLLLKISGQLQYHGLGEAAAEAVPPSHRAFLPPDLDVRRGHMRAKHELWLALNQADDDAIGFRTREDTFQLIPLDPNPICRYYQDKEGDFHFTVAKLNSAIRRLFELHTQEKISNAALLGKISYNIKASSAPPDVATFNTLILGLSMANERELANHTIKGVLRCNMRPNEVTLAAILNHYTKVNNPSKFALWIELIHGKHNGLMLARPDIAITDAGRARLIPHGLSPDKTLQLPYANPMVFGAVVAGVLKFSGFDAALQVCKNMGQNEWGLDMSGLTPLLGDCAKRGDWTSGIAIWDQIQALKAKSTRKRSSKTFSERIRIGTYAAMIRLCSTCDQQTRFEEVWSEAVRAHPRHVGILTDTVKAADLPTVEDDIVDAVQVEPDGYGTVEDQPVTFLEQPDDEWFPHHPSPHPTLEAIALKSAASSDVLYERDGCETADILDTPTLAMEYAADTHDLRHVGLKSTASSDVQYVRDSWRLAGVSDSPAFAMEYATGTRILRPVAVKSTASSDVLYAREECALPYVLGAPALALENAAKSNSRRIYGLRRARQRQTKKSYLASVTAQDRGALPKSTAVVEPEHASQAQTLDTLVADANYSQTKLPKRTKKKRVSAQAKDKPPGDKYRVAPSIFEDPEIKAKDDVEPSRPVSGAVSQATKAEAGYQRLAGGADDVFWASYTGGDAPEQGKTSSDTDAKRFNTRAHAKKAPKTRRARDSPAGVHCVITKVTAMDDGRVSSVRWKSLTEPKTTAELRPGDSADSDYSNAEVQQGSKVVDEPRGNKPWFRLDQTSGERVTEYNRSGETERASGPQISFHETSREHRKRAVESDRRTKGSNATGPRILLHHSSTKLEPTLASGAKHLTPVSIEQLQGSMPASPELDEYEAGERPMTVRE